VDLGRQGTGPLILAWVRITVSAILRDDSSTTWWSYAFNLILIFWSAM
jgi:hypothetical protein